MRRRTAIGLGVILIVAAAFVRPAAAQPAAGEAGTVERLDPRLDDLVAADAAIERVADGFQFIEGPVWVGDASDGHLLFSDIPADTVYRWSEADGTSVFLNPVFLPELETGGQGGSNGLTLDLEGRVVLCEHGNRRLARIEADGTRITLADRYEGQRLNSPNDIVYHSSGAAFFTDPPYGLASPRRPSSTGTASTASTPTARSTSWPTARPGPTASGSRPTSAPSTSPTRTARPGSGWPIPSTTTSGSARAACCST